MIVNKNFSIISNDCWAGFVYQRLGLEYNTPFMWTFIYPIDYLKILNNIHYYLSCNLVFRDEPLEYPVGQLADANILFMHCHTKEEAYEKWNRRLSRFNWSNIYVKFSREGLDRSDIVQFDNLNFEHKVCFTEYNCNDVKSCVWLKELQGNWYTTANNQFNVYQKYFDVEKWLNGYPADLCRIDS